MAHADSPTNLLWMLENEPEDAAAAPAPAAQPGNLVSPAMASAALGQPQARGSSSGDDAEGPSFSEFLLNI
jgi:hypothetical protein